MLTEKYPCDFCEQPIEGMTYKEVHLKVAEIRAETKEPTMVMFYCERCARETKSS